MRSLAMLCVALLSGTACAAEKFTLESAEIKPGATIAEAQVFKGFGCEGGNVSPSLKWTGAPAGTKSFALMVYDPDAPTGSGWWHWVAFNIPPGTAALALGASGGQMPAGTVQSKTDFGTTGYGGPCPPKGNKPHRYIFTLYALKVDKLDADANASPAMIGFMANANMLGKASFTGMYGRN